VTGGGLRELLEQGVARAPGEVVITGAGGSLTWAGLHERACRVGAALVRDGVRPGERVAQLGRNHPDFFGALFGCALAGAVPVPLNRRLVPDELAAVLADCDARLLLADDDLADLASAAAARLGRPLLVRSPDGAGAPADNPGAPAEDPAEDPGVPADPAGVALQLYTSGTTGTPKGAMFGPGNLRVLLTDIARAWDLTAGDVSLAVMPLFHMGGLAWALAGLARGARLVVVADFEPGEVLATMRAEGVTTAFFVPTMLAALCARPGPAPERLRTVVYSGSPIGVAALGAAMDRFGCGFRQLYGLTEATGAFAQLEPDEHDPHGPRAHLLRSAGRPYPWVEVRIVDPDGREVPPGAVGEIWTRSAQNLLGYWRRPEETARVLTPDGWLRTGDLGRRDGDGHLFLVDRARDLVISGGENVYPAEVERALAGHPDLAEVAVIGVPDPRWGETVKAVVVAAPGARVDPAGVIAYARERLAAFKCPTSVDVVTELPRTATGKVRKPELRERYWRDHDRRIH
jgi:acyl-CoA synthetase (AMP-forming)/AMP-acid ligase II